MTVHTKPLTMNQRIINGRIMTVLYQWRTCGKRACPCHTDKERRHGRYWYGYAKVNGKLKCFYIGKTLPTERGRG